MDCCRRSLHTSRFYLQSDRSPMTLRKELLWVTPLVFVRWSYLRGVGLACNTQLQSTELSVCWYDRTRNAFLDSILTIRQNTGELCMTNVKRSYYHRTPTEQAVRWSEDTTTRIQKHRLHCSFLKPNRTNTLTPRPHRCRKIAIRLHDPLNCCAKFMNSRQKCKMCRRIMWQRLTVFRFTFTVAFCCSCW